MLGCASRLEPARVPELSLVLRTHDHGVVTLRQLTQTHEVTVLVAWSAGCPCVRRYQARVDGLLDAFPQNRVRIIAMVSNAGETQAQVDRVAHDRAVRVPIFFDEGGHVASALGLRSTPGVAMLDQQGRLRFLGWIDNERGPGDPGREPYLERAIAGVLADRRDFPSRSPVFGCPITRDLFAGRSHACCTQTPSEKPIP
jgi:hypothetical protein